MARLGDRWSGYRYGICGAVSTHRNGGARWDAGVESSLLVFSSFCVRAKLLGYNGGGARVK